MSDSSGSTTPLMLAIVGLVLFLVVATTDAGLILAAHHQAAAAADAAALAAAPVTFRPFGASSNPKGEAARFAEMNGARLTRCRCAVDRSWRPRTVDVVVERTVTVVGGASITVRARSAAAFDPALVFLGQRPHRRGRRSSGGRVG